MPVISFRTSRSPFRWIFGPLLCTLALQFGLRTLYAQATPGAWHRVVLPQPARSGNDNTMAFGFADSLYGICLSDNGLISSTRDGGRSWILDTDIGENTFVKGTLASLECTAPHRGFAFGNSTEIVITPGATQQLTPPNAREVNYGSYNTLAEKMYDTAYGFRLVQYVSPESENQYNPQVAVIVTHDAWRSSSIYGETSLAPISRNPYFNAGYIADSNDVWTAKGRNNVWNGKTIVQDPKLMLHSTDGGQTWDSTDAFDSALYLPWVQDFCVRPTTREVFCLVNNSAIDYAYSSDYGKTWRVDSTFGNGKLWRLANPAPEILWAMISEGGSATIEVHPPQDAHGLDSNDYCRKLAYSSDNGAHWVIDSTTFRDDSLEEMHWLDARHGWIASWSHDSLWMWYYDADGANAVAEHGHPDVPAYSLLYPNPVRTTLNIDAPGLTGAVIVEDALGRLVLRATLPASDRLALDVRSLPSGPYMVIVGNLTEEFVKM